MKVKDECIYVEFSIPFFLYCSLSICKVRVQKRCKSGLFQQPNADGFLVWLMPNGGLYNESLMSTTEKIFIFIM